MNQTEKQTVKSENILTNSSLPKKRRPRGMGFYFYPLLISVLTFLSMDFLGRKGILPYTFSSRLVNLETSLKNIEQEINQKYKEVVTISEMKKYLEEKSSLPELETKINHLKQLIQVQKDRIHSLEATLKESLSDLKNQFTTIASSQSVGRPTGQTLGFSKNTFQALSDIFSIELAVRQGEDFKQSLNDLISFCKDFSDVAKNIHILKTFENSSLASDNDLINDLKQIEEKLQKTSLYKDQHTSFMKSLSSLISIKKKGEFDIDDLISLVKAGKLRQLLDNLEFASQRHSEIFGTVIEKIKKRIHFEHNLNSLTRKLKHHMVFAEKVEK